MIVGACGLKCSECDAYKATQAGDTKWVARIAVEWSREYGGDIKPEYVWCDGCLTSGQRKCGHTGECEIRACAAGRKIENCAGCAGYPCGRTNDFFGMFPDAKSTIDTLRAGGYRAMSGANVVDPKIRYILDNYLDVIRREFAPTDLWLWGSRVYGHPDEYSDVDMILVSDRFRDVRFLDRRQLFRDLIGIDWDHGAWEVDVLCYTRAEFAERKANPTIVREAIQKGIKV